MSYDIYGNPLRRGHCEVHPHVHEEYPCSVCMTESRRHQEEQSPAQCNGNPAHCESAHCLGQALEEIKRLNDEVQALRKDAERYKWLRDMVENQHFVIAKVGSWSLESWISDDPDRYIDEVMEQKK